MRKLDLIKKVAEITTLDKVDVLVALDEIIKQIKGEVMIGNKVSLHKFGTFKAANIKNSDYAPVFIPSEEFGHLVAEYLNEEQECL